MSQLENQPLSQIGLSEDPGTRIVPIEELARLFDDPIFYAAADTARRCGAQFRGRNSAAHELIEKSSRAARLHAAEQHRAQVLKAKQERTNELAQFA